MSVDAVSTFLAVGSLLLLALVVAIAVTRVLAFVSERVRAVHDAIRRSIDGQGLLIAWLMAVAAMAGSLYYSEIAGFPPCEYCWYQRIAMYPLVIVLGIATLNRDATVRRYVYPLAGIGAAIAGYHYLIQRLPDLSVGECSFGLPCTAAWVWKFDLVSIPFMAFVAFSVILTALALDRSGTKTLVADTRDPEPESVLDPQEPDDVRTPTD